MSFESILRGASYTITTIIHWFVNWLNDSVKSNVVFDTGSSNPHIHRQCRTSQLLHMRIGWVRLIGFGRVRRINTILWSFRRLLVQTCRRTCRIDILGRKLGNRMSCNGCCRANSLHVAYGLAVRVSCVDIQHRLEESGRVIRSRGPQRFYRHLQRTLRPCSQSLRRGRFA